MPETLIEPHKVLSPLPKQLPAVQIDVFEDGYEKTVKKEDIIRADALVPGKYARCTKVKEADKYWAHF